MSEFGRYTPEGYANWHNPTIETPLTNEEHDQGVRQLEKLFQQARSMGLRSNEQGLVA